jgi:hypothetical protein
MTPPIAAALLPDGTRQSAEDHYQSAEIDVRYELAVESKNLRRPSRFLLVHERPAPQFVSRRLALATDIPPIIRRP